MGQIASNDRPVEINAMLGVAGVYGLKVIRDMNLDLYSLLFEGESVDYIDLVKKFAASETVQTLLSLPGELPEANVYFDDVAHLLEGNASTPGAQLMKTVLVDNRLASIAKGLDSAVSLFKMSVGLGSGYFSSWGMNMMTSLFLATIESQVPKHVKTTVTNWADKNGYTALYDEARTAYKTG